MSDLLVSVPTGVCFGGSPLSVTDRLVLLIATRGPEGCSLSPASMADILDSSPATIVRLLNRLKTRGAIVETSWVGVRGITQFGYRVISSITDEQLSAWESVAPEVPPMDREGMGVDDMLHTLLHTLVAPGDDTAAAMEEAMDADELLRHILEE